MQRRALLGIELLDANHLCRKETKEILLRGFSWGQRPAIFADHWTTNDLKVTRHKSITIIHFFLSERIFSENMVSISSNDRFANDNIFLPNIWYFSIITGINYVSIFFLLILKIHVIVTARCRVQCIFFFYHNQVQFTKH